jgi:hypothetical protein
MTCGSETYRANRCRGILGGNLRLTQRHQMAPLVGVTADLRVVLAAHVPFEFEDRHALRAAHDVEGDGLVRVAAQAADLDEVAAAGVERVPQRRGQLGGPFCSRASADSRRRMPADRAPCALPSRVRRSGGCWRRRCILSTWYPSVDDATGRSGSAGGQTVSKTAPRKR